MDITTITITISVVMLLLAIVSPLCNPFFRLPKKEEDDSDGEEKSAEPISVVIIAHDNAPELKHHLTSYLTQDYPTGYEVIVVADRNDPETEDIIKLYADYKHLYATYLPTSSYYISRRKLAVTVGMKAVHNKWAIITDAWCCPDSDQWLKAMARECTEDKDIVLGYTHFEEEKSSHCHYEHLRTALYDMRMATHSSAYGCNSPLIAMRKELFLKEDGYVGNLQYVRGEYDFLANKFGARDRSSVAMDEEASMTEVMPVYKQWVDKHIHYISYRKSMKGNTKMRMLYHFDMAMMHLCNLAIIAGIAYGVIVQDYIALGASVLAFIIEYALRAFISSKALETFNAPVNSFLVPLLDFIQPLHDVIWKIRYIFADKYDFITHKV